MGPAYGWQSDDDDEKRADLPRFVKTLRSVSVGWALAHSPVPGRSGLSGFDGQIDPKPSG
jgi:hypothetical protein